METVSISTFMTPECKELQSKYKLKYDTFIKGEVIKCSIKAEGFDEIRHRGIKAQLVSEISNNGERIAKDIVVESNIASSGVLSYAQSLKFTIPITTLQYSSYYGQAYTIEYKIYIIISKLLFKDLVFNKSIIILFPQTRPNKKTPIPINIVKMPIYFDIVVEQSVYDIYDTLKGYAVFNNDRLAKLGGISIRLVCDEIFPGHKNSVFTILEYEIVDGCPRPGVTVPFEIDLSLYCNKIWAQPGRSQLKVNHRLEIGITRNDGAKSSSSHNITIGFMLPERKPLNLFS